MGRWARKPVNHTSWVAAVTPTDRPKSVRNRCVIELFCGVVCVVTLPFWYFCWCRGFCHRTESDLFLFSWPELASRWAEHSLLWRVSLYIIDILFYHLTCLCNNSYGLSALFGCWSSAFLRRIIYKFLNVCPFDYTAFAISGNVGIPLTGLTTPVGWLSLPQLTVLSRSAIVV